MKGKIPGYHVIELPINTRKSPKNTIPKDTGCAAARKYYGYTGKCKDCTIVPHCLEHFDKGVPIKTRIRRNRVELLYKEGLTANQIAKQLNAPRRAIKKDIYINKGGY